MSREQINQQIPDEEEDDEGWEVLRDHPDYEICREYPHQIRKISTHRILKESIQTKGYLQVILNGKKYLKHRLIALQWIDNPDPEHLTQIDHLNHTKTDNHIDNLSWVTNNQNANNRHTAKNGRNIEYVQTLPDNAIIVNHYNNCTFNDYYYDDDRFFKQIHNGKYRVIPWCPSGKYFIAALTDTDNVSRSISKKKFKKLYNIA